MQDNKIFALDSQNPCRFKNHLHIISFFHFSIAGEQKKELPPETLSHYTSLQYDHKVSESSMVILGVSPLPNYLEYSHPHILASSFSNESEPIIAFS